MMELITDRTAADVARLAQLNAKGWDNLTALERMEWYHGRETLPLRWSDGEPLTCTDGALLVYPDAMTNKGGYNYTDLNRVTAALEALDALLASYGYATGYAPILVLHDRAGLDPGRWYEGDHMPPALAAAYLANVAAIRAALPLAEGTATAPGDMEGLTAQEANDIESILLAVEDTISRMARVINLGWALGLADVGIYGGLA